MIDKRIVFIYHCFLLNAKPCLRVYSGPVCNENLGYPTGLALYYSMPTQVDSMRVFLHFPIEMHFHDLLT